jgi:hypothetical protein
VPVCWLASELRSIVDWHQRVNNMS